MAYIEMSSSGGTLRCMEAHALIPMRPGMRHALHARALPHCQELISLGTMDPHRREDVLHAIQRSNSFARQALCLIVATERSAIALPSLDGVDIRWHSREELAGMLEEYRERGRLLLPCANEDYGNAFLHALVSGVPLDAINFAHVPRHGDSRCLPREGEMFLGIIGNRSQ